MIVVNLLQRRKLSIPQRALEPR